MSRIKVLPTYVPDWEAIVDRSSELGALLFAIHSGSNAHDDRDRLCAVTTAALTQIALRLHGELDEMLARRIELSPLLGGRTCTDERAIAVL